MQCISKDALYHRTQLMGHGQAEAFARCLSANALFSAVTVEESKTAKSERRFFVRYQPASEQRYRELAQSQANEREQRAHEQAGSYLFVLEEGRRFFYCWNVESGEVYEVTHAGCDCPDHQYRGAVTGGCKHVRMLRSGTARTLTWEELGPATVAPEPVLTPAERSARALADRALWD